MKSEELELFPFVIISGRNSDNCDIILIEMPLHERGKVVLYKFFAKNVEASQCVCSMYRVYVSRT